MYSDAKGNRASRSLKPVMRNWCTGLTSVSKTVNRDRILPSPSITLRQIPKLLQQIKSRQQNQDVTSGIADLNIRKNTFSTRSKRDRSSSWSPSLATFRRIKALKVAIPNNHGMIERRKWVSSTPSTPKMLPKSPPFGESISCTSSHSRKRLLDQWGTRRETPYIPKFDNNATETVMFRRRVEGPCRRKTKRRKKVFANFESSE
mmetsp:Transcript_40692/g.68067  ORF Transcript_40692/g.68067 Transcript_40692/m.68067 type:complete len:204 (-) Transcript_40692:111-722(-)